MELNGPSEEGKGNERAMTSHFWKWQRKSGRHGHPRK